MVISTRTHPFDTLITITVIYKLSTSFCQENFSIFSIIPVGFKYHPIRSLLPPPKRPDLTISQQGNNPHFHLDNPKKCFNVKVKQYISSVEECHETQISIEQGKTIGRLPIYSYFQLLSCNDLLVTFTSSKKVKSLLLNLNCYIYHPFHQNLIYSNSSPDFILH